MVGIDWTTAIWRKSVNKAKNLFTNQLKECVIDYSIFAGMDMPGANFHDCISKEALFEDANLQESNFDGTDLSGSIFKNTNLSKADFSKARNYTINAGSNNITKAKFSFPEAVSLIYSLDIDIVEE